MQWKSIKLPTDTRRSTPAKIFFWLAVAMLVGWFAARWWGITEPHTITRGQRRWLIAGGVFFAIGWIPLPRFPKFRATVVLNSPTWLEVFFLALGAALTVAVDVLWSRIAGILAYPPIYDGVSYVLDSARTVYLFASLFENPEVLRISSAPNFSFTPVWKILMMLHYWAIGIGEWQAYSVRFWPTFLLLFLILWVVRQHGDRRFAWAAVAFTMLLPTINVSVRASVLQFYFPGSSSIGWYIGDLRPDLLFAVLLAWATVPLLHFARSPDSRVWLISGCSAALALLTKPSALTLLILSWGLASAIVFFINRERLKEALSTSAWGFGTFVVIIMPWVAFGGLARIFRYIYRSAVSQRELWSNADATLWGEITYYWNWYSIHMGPVEAWFVLGCAAVAVIVLFKKEKNTNGWIVAAFGYLLIALGLYTLITVSPSKNYFLGLPFSIILWLFSWVTISHLLKGLGERKRFLAWMPVFVAFVYAAGIFSAFAYAVKNWPAANIKAAAQSRAVIAQIAGDLSHILSPSDKFLSAPLFGIPATVQFYLIQRDGSYPRQCPFDPLISPPERVVDKLGSDCKAMLLYRNNDEQRNRSPAPPAALIRWEAVAAWVKNPLNHYRVVRTYEIASLSPSSNFDIAPDTFTMDLYVLDTQSAGSGS